MTHGLCKLFTLVLEQGLRELSLLWLIAITMEMAFPEVVLRESGTNANCVLCEFNKLHTVVASGLDKGAMSANETA